MTKLELTQRLMARSLAVRAVTANPQSAITEWQSTGLQAADLGKWAYLPQALEHLPQAEQATVESIQGGFDLVGEEESPEADPIAELAHRLHRDKFASDLSVRLQAAMADLSGGGDPATVAERIAQAVSSLKDGRAVNRGDRPLTNELPGLAEAILEGKQVTKPVPTGISKLDAVIYGWQPTLNLIGADPGVGKSGTIVKAAYNGACLGIKSAVFCLEDPPRFISTRLVSHISRIEVLRILYGKLTKDEFAAVENALEELGKVSDNILVYDGSERPMAVERLCAIGRSLVSTSGVQCIYVDHAGELS